MTYDAQIDGFHVDSLIAQAAFVLSFFEPEVFNKSPKRSDSTYTPTEVHEYCSRARENTRFIDLDLDALKTANGFECESRGIKEEQRH